MAEGMLFDKFGILVDSGKVIFKEGEPGDQMYIIQDGSVRISKSIAGKEHILAVLSKGDFFGEMAIVNQASRSATATAVGTVKLLAFNREGFISMIEKNARIALSIIDKLCRRLQQTNQQIQHLVRKNEKGLIAMNLYYAFAEKGLEKAELEYHKTARDIALNLELPQDSVIFYLEELKLKNVIQVDKNVMILRDRYALAALAETATGTK